MSKISIPTTALLICVSTCLAAAPTTDSRQQRLVTVTSSYEPLATTLAELSRQTEVDLAAGEEALARHRLILLAKERPLGEVRAQIARFVGLPPGGSYWARRGVENAATYRLMESRASKEARAKRLRDRNARTTARIREALTLAGLDEEALAAQRERNPRLAAARNNFRAAYALFRSLTPAQFDAALQSGRLSLPFSMLTPQQQQLVQGSVSRVRIRTFQPAPNGGETVSVYDGSRDFASSSVMIGLSGSAERPGFRVMVQMDRESALGCPNVLDPPIPNADERPDWLADALEKSEAAEKAKRKRALGPRPPKDPDLLRRVTVHQSVFRPAVGGVKGKSGPYAASIGDALREIAAQTGLPVIGDFDPCYEDPFSRQGMQRLPKDLVDVPLWEALDTLAEVWDLQWEKKDGWLRVRSPRAPYALSGELDLAPVGETERLAAERAKTNTGAPAP
jgi:hypothetical protein